MYELHCVCSTVEHGDKVEVGMEMEMEMEMGMGMGMGTRVSGTIYLKLFLNMG